ncbi:MAG: hypothetical protein ACREB9_09430, partial [Thermoplasmata archaeon]
SASQRERLETLLTIMRKLMERPQGSFTLAEVQEEAKQSGVDAQRTEALFFVLRNQGEIMEPQPDVWQLVRF